MPEVDYEILEMLESARASFREIIKELKEFSKRDINLLDLIPGFESSVDEIQEHIDRYEDMSEERDRYDDPYSPEYGYGEVSAWA